jgi:hypothetical protein
MMVAIDGSRVSDAMGASVLAGALVMVALIGSAVWLTRHGVRSLRTGIAPRSGAAAALAMAAALLAVTGWMGSGLVRFGAEQWGASRAERAGGQVAQRCLRQWVDLGPGPEGYPPDAVDVGRPPVKDRNENSVWRDDWLAHCRQRALLER